MERMDKASSDLKTLSQTTLIEFFNGKGWDKTFIAFIWKI
jgi:hypothetical protein